MTKTWMRMGTLLVGATFLLGSCGEASVRDPQEMQIRSYEVPKGQNLDEVRALLRESLATGEQKLGTVRAAPDGSLVVTAPASVQRGIEGLLAEMARRGPRGPEPAPASITVDYWFLIGRPRPGAGVTVASPVLEKNAALRPVLDEIVGSQGGTEFHLLEQLELTSLDNGARAEIRGRRAAAQQKVVAYGSGESLADIAVTLFGADGVRYTLESRIKLAPSRFVVLGQTAYNGEGDLAGVDASEDLMLYYIVSSAVD